MADMANYWAQEGWHVTLATWSGRDLADFYALSPSVSRAWLDVDARGASILGRLHAFVLRVAKLRKLLRAAQPDAVLSFIDVSNIHTILAARGLETRVVISERTHPGLNRTVSRPWRALRRLCYPWADEVVAQTQDAALWIERRCKIAVLVIPNSVRPLTSPTAAREPLIIAVGRLSKEKGFEILLEAFARVSPRFPDWRVCIIGEGPERLALTALAERLNLRGRIELAGQVHDVEEWMGRAALMVHPSRREGFPNAVLEAMAMGVAVICANCSSGPSELIEDGINGRLVRVDDVEELAHVMATLMADSSGRERLGLEAAMVRRRYSTSEIMEQWETCLLRPPRRKTRESLPRVNPG